jgi:eukaryotic-like serine/threonine-protein kinase
MSSSFLAELKRRRVVRVALVYGAVAFAVAQAADVFVPALALPGSIITAVALLAVLGFPVALVLAWAYDIVPEGGASDVPAAAATDGVGGEGLADSGGATPPRRRDPAWLGGRTVAVVAVLVTVGLALGAGWLLPAGPANRAVRSAGEAPPPSPWVTRIPLAIDGTRLRGPPSLSPDGRQIAWATPEGIHVRAFDRLEDRTLPATEGARGPFWSPDGRSLGFHVEGTPYVIGLDGGSPRGVGDSVISGAGVWTGDGWIYARVPAGDVVRIREDGALLESVLARDSARWFQPSSTVHGERWILGTLRERADEPDGETRERIAVLDPGTGAMETLVEGQLPYHEPLTDHLVFLRQTALMAVAFDPARAEVVGTPFVVADNTGFFGLARDGTLWYVQGAINRNIPVVVDRRGQRRAIMPELRENELFETAFFSPDGDRLVVVLRPSGAAPPDLYVYELPAGPLTRLTYDGVGVPAWSPDGRWILFSRDDGVYRVRADASAPPRQVLRAEGIWWISQPTPAGDIIFDRHNGTDFDVGTASLRGDDEIRMLVEGPANERDPALSPDGRWLAYASDETGRREVYVMPFGPAGRGQRISVAGGNNPLWSGDGRTLFFRNGQDEFEAVRIGTGPDLELLERSVLFDVTGLAGRFHPAPGDSLFMARRTGGPTSDARIVLVRNWASELFARAEVVRNRDHPSDRRPPSD